MSGFKGDKLKEKLPKPVPDSKLESERVGLDDVLQQIPRFVIVLPPSEIIDPPTFAEVNAISDAAVVVNYGIVKLEEVGKETKSPKPVPIIVVE